MADQLFCEKRLDWDAPVTEVLTPNRNVAEEVVHATKWQTASRYMMVGAFAQIDQQEIDPIFSIKAA